MFWLVGDGGSPLDRDGFWCLFGDFFSCVLKSARFSFSASWCGCCSPLASLSSSCSVGSFCCVDDDDDLKNEAIDQTTRRPGASINCRAIIVPLLLIEKFLTCLPLSSWLAFQFHKKRKITGCFNFGLVNKVDSFVSNRYRAPWPVKTQSWSRPGMNLIFCTPLFFKEGKLSSLMSIFDLMSQSSTAPSLVAAANLLPLPLTVK